MDDQRDYAEEAANRRDMEREGDEELAAEQMREGKRRREDDTEPCTVLRLAVIARQMSGSTHARAAREEAKV